MSRSLLIFFFAFLSLLEVSAQMARPDQFVIVGVAGFGTRRPENPWQPSAVHDELPYHNRLQEHHRLVHYANDEEVSETLEAFECHKGEQKRKDLGLIIMANSWGSSKAIDLARLYKEKCSREVDMFFMIDGVRKPMFANGTRPPARQCFSYYQRKGLIRGKAIRGCTNINYTDECEVYGLGAVECHIHTEWEGAKRAKNAVHHFLEGL